MINVFTYTYTLSSTQILNMYASSVTITLYDQVQATKALVIIGEPSLEYKTGSSGYSNGGLIHLEYTGATGTNIYNCQKEAIRNNTNRVMNFQTNVAGTGAPTFPNNIFILRNLTGAFTGGDGTAIVRFNYMIIELTAAAT